MELISVIVPVYNVEKYLPACIESILCQTYSELEIILVNDGSPDKCPEICDEYAKKDSRVKVIHQSNQGLSSARNTGIDNSSGKYIIFVDSDDTIEPTMVEDLYTCVIKYNCSMAACGRKYVFEDGKVVCKVPDNIEKVFSFSDAIREMNTYFYFDMSAWAKIYKRELFDNIRFPVGRLSEDFFIMYKLIALSQKVAYISKPLYNYLQRKSSISRNKNINHDFITAAREQMEFLDKNYPELAIIGHTAYASANLTVLDFYIKNGVDCPREKLNEFRKAVRDNMEYIKSNKYLSKSKRIQFSLFLFSYHIYKLVFSIYRKVVRV